MRTRLLDVRRGFGDGDGYGSGGGTGDGGGSTSSNSGDGAGRGQLGYSRGNGYSMGEVSSVGPIWAIGQSPVRAMPAEWHITQGETMRDDAVLALCNPWRTS